MSYIGAHLNDHARLHPLATALSFGDQQISWSVFRDKVDILERYLGRHSLRGDRIGLCFQDQIALLTCFFACARTGRIAMVMDPDWPELQRGQILKATSPAIVLDDAASRKSLSGPPDGSFSQATSPDEAQTTVQPNDPFYAGFTSGSTGNAKGFVRSHKSWINSFRLSEHEFAKNRSAAEPGRVLLPARLTHSLHLYGAVHGLQSGKEVCVFGKTDPRPILSSLRKTGKPSALYATPTQLRLIADAAGRSGAFSHVDLVFSGGDKWLPEDCDVLRQVFPNARLVEFYGASETSFISLARPEDRAPGNSVGRPADGVEVCIGKPDIPLASGIPGPIWVKSDQLFDGYICGGSPLTRWHDGWLTFGDHGYLDKDGFLYVSGREARMIISAGLNIYPEEIESQLMKRSEVVAVVAFGRPDKLRGERLEAAVLPSRIVTPDEDALLAYCRDTLGASKTPRRIHFLSEFPMLPGGKPDILKITRRFSGSADAGAE